MPFLWKFVTTQFWSNLMQQLGVYYVWGLVDWDETKYKPMSLSKQNKKMYKPMCISLTNHCLVVPREEVSFLTGKLTTM